MTEQKRRRTQKAGLSVLGFGFAQRQRGGSKFTPREMHLELEDTGYSVKRGLILCRAKILADKGLLDTIKVVESQTLRRGPKPVTNYEVNEAGINELFGGLEYYVRRHGCTLLDVLQLPSSVEAIKEDGRFAEGLLGVIMGDQAQTDWNILADID